MIDPKLDSAQQSANMAHHLYFHPITPAPGAAQRSALIQDGLRDQELSQAPHPISFATFAAACQRLQPTAATIRVTCVEICKMTWSSYALVQATTGFLGHQYIVATVLLPDGRCTYIKADYLAEDHPCGSKLILTFNDDRNALTAGSYTLSRMVSPHSWAAGEHGGTEAELSGPSLADLASLLGVASTRLGTRPYRVLSRNCLWMADTLFYALARRYAAHWLAGVLTPDAPLRLYLRREAGVLETAIACTLSGEAARRYAWWAAYAVRWVHVQSTWGEAGAGRYMMHDEEVADWLGLVVNSEVPLVVSKMSYASSSANTPSSPSAITLASRSCALISNMFAFSELSSATYPLPMDKWIDCLQKQPISKALFLVYFEIWMDTAPSSTVVRATAGILGHQFNVFTIGLPDGRKTHIRVDYRDAPIALESSSQLDVSLSDDHKMLTKDSRLISRIITPTWAISEKAGPSLAALTALFTVAYKRHIPRPYTVSGYNCFWMTDMLFYSIARRYGGLWLPGRHTPDEPLRRYLRGEAGVLDTSVSCATEKEGARRFALWTGSTWRKIQVWATQNRENRIMMHDEEVALWITNWMSSIECLHFVVLAPRKYLIECT
ncbi:hypothetical protein VTO73DRAFT_9172 [Trametes versicolor]